MKIENRQQMLVAVAVAAVALLIADRAALTPLTALWKSRSTRIAELRKQIEQGSSLVQREQSLRRRWDEMRRNALPSNPSLAEQQLLKGFDGWARESRANLTLLSPQWKHEDDYMTLECRVDASGDLETLTWFLYNIERDPMALKLELVELTAHDDSGQQMTIGLQVGGLGLTPATP